MATSRFDIQSGVDRLLFYSGWGHFLGLPTRPGTSSAATTGIPTNGIVGFAPGALFYNFLGGPGTALYCNIGSNGWVNASGGTNAAATWLNIDSPDGGLVSLITTATITAVLNSGRTMLLSLAGGFTSTLPAATGTGNIYRFIVNVVSTTGYVITAAGSDVFKGSLWNVAAGATAGTGCTFTSTSNQNITLNGTTKGGAAIGDWIQLQDIASGVWTVTGLTTGSGTLATPFS